MSERVPEGWTKTRLSEFSSARRGTTYFASELSQDKERYPLYINMKSFKVGGGYNESGDKYFSSPYSLGQIVRENDLLIANTDVTDACDILGAAVYLPREKLLEDVLFSHHVSALNIADDVDVNFLSFLFGSKNSRLEMKRCGRGTTVKMLDMKDIGRIFFSIPPLPEQKKIASILTSVDEVIETTQRQIDKLQDLKKATMNELLTKGIGHTEFKDSELGRIPKSWSVKRLPQICTYQNGKAFPSSEYLDSDSNGFYLIKPVNLEPDGTVNWQYSSTAKINENFWDTEPKYRVGGDEILMNLTAQSLEDEFLGRVCKTNLQDQCLLNQRIARITPILKCITNEFLFWVLKGKHFRDHVSRITQGSKVQHLYNQNLDEANLCIPSNIEEQKEIASTLDSLNDIIRLKCSKLSQTQSLKKSLMQDLLTGKVRVQVN